MSSMTCQEFTDFLMAYLDGELPENQRLIFEQHLDLCPPCIRYLDSYKQTVKMGKAAFECPGEEIPEDVPERLVQAILKTRNL